MREWLVIFAVVLLVVAFGSTLLPSLLLTLDELREKRAKARRRVIILVLAYARRFSLQERELMFLWPIQAH
jgi:hypothetical protein